MTQDDVGQLQVGPAVEGVEEEDAPEHVQQDEGQADDGRGHEEVVGVAIKPNGTGPRHVSQNIDEGEGAGDDAEPQARHCDETALMSHFCLLYLCLPCPLPS